MNERFLQQQGELRRSAIYLALTAAVLWIVSYISHYSAAQAGEGMWFAALSVFTLLGAVGTTVGAFVCAGIFITQAPPLEGANR